MIRIKKYYLNNDDVIVSSRMDFPVRGIMNPVMAAMCYLDSCGMEIDHDSFRLVAENTPDHNGEGFLVQNTEDLYKLCEIGKFSMCKNKFRSHIAINGSQIHLGYFDDAQSAHEAYKTAAKERFGEFWNPGDGGVRQ